MRRVFSRSRRFAALLALVTVLIAQGAFAADRERGHDRSIRDRIETAKHFIISVLGRLGGPPGED
jgi:hypothetical protein